MRSRKKDAGKESKIKVLTFTIKVGWQHQDYVMNGKPCLSPPPSLTIIIFI